MTLDRPSARDGLSDGPLGGLDLRALDHQAAVKLGLRDDASPTAVVVADRARDALRSSADAVDHRRDACADRVRGRDVGCHHAASKNRRTHVSPNLPKRPGSVTNVSKLSVLITTGPP